MNNKDIVRIKVELNEEGLAIGACPYNREVIAGGAFCKRFCRFNFGNDYSTKEVRCACDFRNPLDVEDIGNKQRLREIKGIWK